MLDLIVCCGRASLSGTSGKIFTLCRTLGRSRRVLPLWFLLDLIAVFPVAHILEIYEAAAPGDNISAEDKNVLKFILGWCVSRSSSASPHIRPHGADGAHLSEAVRVVRPHQDVLQHPYCAHLIACLWYLCGVAGGDSGWIVGVEETADTIR